MDGKIIKVSLGIEQFRNYQKVYVTAVSSCCIINYRFITLKRKLYCMGHFPSKDIFKETFIDHIV
jgi:hypothetical protein